MKVEDSNLKFLNPFLEYDFHEKLTLKKDDLIFFSGSLVECIGNARSDLDIFVLYSKASDRKTYDYDFGELKTEFKRVLEINCDIEYWPIEVLQNIIEQINNINFSNDKRTINHLMIKGYNFKQLSSLLHRFYVSVPHNQNTEMYLSIRETLNESNYFRMMTRFYINAVDNLYDDVIGTMENNDLLTSLHISKSMLVNSLMALLFSKSVSIDREKWVFKKLEKLSSTDKRIEDIYVKSIVHYFERIGSLNEDIEDIVTLSNNIIESIET
ncbi:hypothetical protein EDD68_1317 [Melghiribacillus thermohalophilus]|uniref:Nucleotidyltransferase-like protein n=1 Tax=Melghiribacillus thermohalophilus TaxID=1324956 RepID=A0A4R3MU63_9BACI|nr:hypothetical protein [Melghiribacillus thermohalophilus]TCT17488.1 hypothetical protein EDD68_1317 [Melghiribacillus thermohalophilus]